MTAREEVDSLYRELYRLSRITARSFPFFYSKELHERIKKVAGKLLEKARNAEIPEEMLENLRETVSIFLNILDRMKAGKLDLFSQLSVYGLGEEIFSDMKRFAEERDFQETLKDFHEICDIFFDEPVTESELESVKKVAMEFLPKIYERFFSELFSDLNEYLKTVNFSVLEEHGHQTGKVYFSLKNFNVLCFVDNEVKRRPARISILKKILHECGHQLNFFLTTRSELPVFMKKPLFATGFVGQELIACAFERFWPEFESDEEESRYLEIHSRIHGLKVFLKAYPVYLYYTQGPEEASRYLYNYTGNRYYLGKEFRNWLEFTCRWKLSEHSNLDWWTDSLVRFWITIKSEEIPLGNLKKLCRGIWAPKTFMKISGCSKAD
ncbi:MAG: hypothetical protein GXO63_02435 [Candidatus Micrarchaeota archaeon]|nr:hypothetical protein [Candidatus Micrarchaeota archaeon]